jgi:hypothetical protein
MCGILTTRRQSEMLHPSRPNGLPKLCSCYLLHPFNTNTSVHTVKAATPRPHPCALPPPHTPAPIGHINHGLVVFPVASRQQGTYLNPGISPPHRIPPSSYLAEIHGLALAYLATPPSSQHIHGFDNKTLFPLHDSLWQSLHANQLTPPWLIHAKYSAKSPNTCKP